MLVDGRLSVRMVAPVRKFAGAFPPLATWIFHVHGVPSVVALLTVSVLTAVRSGAVTVTTSLPPLLPSLLSATTFEGSTAHTPPVGFVKTPTAVGVAVKLTSNDPPAPIDDAPLEEQVSVLLAIEQPMFPVIPEAFEMLAEP